MTEKRWRAWYSVKAEAFLRFHGGSPSIYAAEDGREVVCTAVGKPDEPADWYQWDDKVDLGVVVRCKCAAMTTLAILAVDSRTDPCGCGWTNGERVILCGGHRGVFA